jgi:hypothetical protein
MNKSKVHGQIRKEIKLKTKKSTLNSLHKIMVISLIRKHAVSKTKMELKMNRVSGVSNRYNGRTRAM